jgi:Membrane proteins related to metalloendopeptidases
MNKKMVESFLKRNHAKMSYKRRGQKKILVLLLSIVVLAVLINLQVQFLSIYKNVLRSCETISSNTNEFRSMKISNKVLDKLWKQSNEDVDEFAHNITLNMLLNNFKIVDTKHIITDRWFGWSSLIPQHLYQEYYKRYHTIFSDIKIFPVPVDTEHGVTVHYQNSWMGERTYGGVRGHEGTDIMSDNNVRGYFPVVSITDGVVEQKGWLEKGGYRIGIRSDDGAYFYYAHLYSYAKDLEIGDRVTAGSLLGMMGDSGYSKVVGTTGKFDVHLHVGIYFTEDKKEISVNPYWILKYLEKYRISFTRK